MSRRSAHMPPPLTPDRDVLMGPPPVPQQQPFAPSSAQNARDQRDFVEKYYKLKRKYFDLDERHRRMEDELRSSGERNMRMNQERGLLLDRILELEAITARAAPPGHHEPPAPLQPPTSAFPRSLISSRAQNAFTANLRQAMDEIDNEEPAADPALASQQARKRPLDETKDRAEDDVREVRKAPRKPKGAPGAVSGKGRDAGSPLSFSPAPQPSSSAPPPSAPAQTLVSTSGKRIRIKPPVAALPDLAPPPPPPPPAPEPHHAQFVHHAGPPALMPRPRSPGSPLSPPSDGEHHPAPHAEHALDFRHGGSSSGPPLALAAGSPASLRASAAALPPTSIQRFAKPKRLKAHTVTSKTYSIPMVPRDAHGRPTLPLNVGIMTVISLGEVCRREHFHTERYIFPVGYQVTRRYLSANDPNAEVVYNCKILDGGDGPKFQITAADKPDEPIIAGTATGAWSVVVRAANHVRNRQHSNSVSGPDFFGLGQNTIKHLIQELPGADVLKDYVWQNFQEGGPLGGRHAAVIPALPEDYEGTPPSAHRHERHDSKEVVSMNLVQEGDLPLPVGNGNGNGQHVREGYARPRRDSRSSNGNGAMGDEAPQYAMQPPPPPYGRHPYPPSTQNSPYQHSPPPPPHSHPEQGAYPAHLSPAHSHPHSHSPQHAYAHSPHVQGRAHSPAHSHSPSNVRAHPYHHTRSHSSQSQSQPQSVSPPVYSHPPPPPPQPQTYTPPRVPATFAGIMNEYPAEPYPRISPRPESGRGGSGSAEGRGSSRGSMSGSTGEGDSR